MDLVLKTIIQASADLHFNIRHSWSHRSNPNNNYHRNYQSAVNRWFCVVMGLFYIVFMMNSLTSLNIYERIGITILVPAIALVVILSVTFTIFAVIQLLLMLQEWLEGY